MILKKEQNVKKKHEECVYKVSVCFVCDEIV